MKNLLIVFATVLSLQGCKKIIDQQKENFVLSVMTEGQWVVTTFVNAGDTLTTEFNSYTFQFNRDYTVDAIRENVVADKGVWSGDPDAMNITASFPGADAPLSMINGVWHIDKNSLSYVIASQLNGGEEKVLRLDKK